MFRVTSLTSMTDKQVDRWIKRVGLLLLVGLIAFTAFYVIDRYNPIPKPSPLDAQIAAAEQAIKDAPGDINMRGGLADLYNKAARYPEAIAQYDAIIATGQQEVLARMGRATANQKLSNVDAAITDWQRVVDLLKDTEMAKTDRNLATAYYSLGTIAESRGKSADAVGFLTKALEISRSDADTLYALGVSYTSVGKLDEGIATLKSAIAFVPVGWADPYTALATAYTKKGDAPLASWAEAMAQFVGGDLAGAEPKLKALIGGAAEPDAMIGLGLIAETRGDTAAASGWYQKVLDKDPSNPTAQLGMSRVRPIGSASPAASQEGQP
jgi:tetratricopeptide (TPR) repeat protein